MSEIKEKENQLKQTRSNRNRTLNNLAKKVFQLELSFENNLNNDNDLFLYLGKYIYTAVEEGYYQEPSSYFWARKHKAISFISRMTNPIYHVAMFLTNISLAISAIKILFFLIPLFLLISTWITLAVLKDRYDSFDKFKYDNVDPAILLKIISQSENWIEENEKILLDKMDEKIENIEIFFNKNGLVNI